MSSKNLMHPRNPYRNRPNFKELALKYPEFRQYAKQKLCGKIELDFKDPASVRALTTVLLKQDFNLSVELPPNRLVPTLPLRLNYLLWIEDLLALMPAKSGTITGLDIGAGACCIYSIIGAVKNGWHFTTTEADDINYECSLKTIAKNNLSDFIMLKKVERESLLMGNLIPGVLYDFTMCNPPFFDSENMEQKSRTEKRHAPMCPVKGGSTSSDEIAFKGGEVEFIRRIITESQNPSINSQIRIFTTMLGHKSSLEPVLSMVEEAGAVSWTQTEFFQGRTTRWAVAWTFSSAVPLNLGRSSVEKQKIKPPLVFAIESETWKGDYTVATVIAWIIDQLKNLKMTVKKSCESETMSLLMFTARSNTWTHERRKRRAEEKKSGNDQPEAKKMKIDSEFCLKGSLRVRKTEQSTIVVQLDWIEGGSGRESMNQIMQYLKNHLLIDK